jgi:hypothetical protein
MFVRVPATYPQPCGYFAHFTATFDVADTLAGSYKNFLLRHGRRTHKLPVSHP